MNRKILISTLVGAVTGFLLGFLIYGLLLDPYFKANTISYEGLMKDPPDIWVFAVGNILWAWLFSYIFYNWANITTFAKGMSAGIIITIPVALAFDLYMFGSMNLFSSVNLLIIDVAAASIINAIMGGIIGLMLGTGNKTVPAA